MVLWFVVGLLPFGLHFLGIGYIPSSCLVLVIMLMCPLVPQCSSSMGVHLTNCIVGLVAVLVGVVVLLGFSGKRGFVDSSVEMGWLAPCFSLMRLGVVGSLLPRWPHL